MFLNILLFVIVLILALTAGWLTWRAVRSRRLWIKIAGGLVAGLFTLLLGAIAFFGGKGLGSVFFPDAKPAPDLTLAGSPEQIARGEYLVNIACAGCHSQPGADGNPQRGAPLSGGWNISAAEGFGFIGDMVTENLTPGGKLAGYSDGELFRSLRSNINQDGRLLAMMSFLPYKQLSDEDTQAIVAYLRSLPPVQTSGQTGDNLNFLGAVMFGAGMFGPAPEPGAESISAPPRGATAEYGKYVATFGECRGCHGADATGSAATSVSEAIPNPRPLVNAISLEEFTDMMRTGVKPGGNAFPEAMPWQNASMMNDDDLAALYAYLTAPVE